MNARKYQRILDALASGSAFLDLYRVEMAPLAGSIPARTLSESVRLVVRNTEIAQTSELLRAGKTGAIRVLCSDLRAAMKPVIVIARHKLGHLLELAGLTLPREGTKHQLLAEAANALANAVSRHAEAFAAESLPEGTAAQLQRLAQDLTAAVDRSRALRVERGAAIAAGRMEFRRARVAFSILDALVAARCRADVPMLARWRSATRGA